MRRSKKGMTGDEVAPRDAVDWFVENESDRELGEADVLQWEEWCNDPRNRETYERILEIRRAISELPEPSAVSGEELLRDAFAELGLEGLGGKKPLN